MIRLIAPRDYPELRHFLYTAIHVAPGAEPPRPSIVDQPDLAIYIDSFGDIRGDIGVVAEESGRIVGAAWARLMRGYGHVDDDTPEVAMAVVPDSRGRGIGTSLIRRLCDVAYVEGFGQLSLSVHRTNPAIRLYERVGFHVVNPRAEDVVMVCELDPQAALPLGIYRHYKGNRYELLGTAVHSETLELLALYRPLYGAGRTWVRPLRMWSELVEVDGTAVRRFARESGDGPQAKPSR